MRYGPIVGIAALTLLPSTAHAFDCAEDVSIVQLLATPKAFHDKWVRVIGYLDLAVEHPRFYLHREDYEIGIEANSLAIHGSTGLRVFRAQLHHRYVLIEGVFNGDARAITRIRRCMLWGGAEGPAVNADHQPCS